MTLKRILPLVFAVLLSAPLAPAPAATARSCQEDCLEAADAICYQTCPTNTCRAFISGWDYCCECLKSGISPRGCQFER